MRVLAICLKCGSQKSNPFCRCTECDFTPSLDDEIIQSVYLSTNRYSDNTKKRQYEPILLEVANQIKSGDKAIFDPDEIIRLKYELEVVTSISYPQTYLILLNIFLPGLAFLSLTVVVLMLIKLLK